MKLENQVVNLKYAKKLKELGFKQDSIWYWWVDTYGTVKKAILKKGIPNNPKDGWTFYSAYTVAELLDFINEEVVIPKEVKNVANHLAEKIIDSFNELKVKNE